MIESLAAEALDQLDKKYQYKWWRPEFVDSQPTVAFLMQVINRQFFQLEKLEAQSLQERLYARDREVEEAITHVSELAVRYSRLAVADMMGEGRGNAMRFAIYEVMTEDDRRDLSALLAGIDKQAESAV